MVISAELKVKQPRIYKNTKENYIRDLESIDFHKLKDFILKGQLNEKEHEELYLIGGETSIARTRKNASRSLPKSKMVLQ